MRQPFYGRCPIAKSLADLWALVGGASQGIGESTARLLAERGANLVLMARRNDVLEKVRASLPNPERHRVLALDLENSDLIADSLTRLHKEIGPISIWVNNTGGPAGGLLSEASAEQLERAFKGHIVASQLILKALLPGMRSKNFGRIVNVLSTSVKAPIPNLGVSNIMRAGMAAWAKTLSAELGPFGITVNNVLPGYTETPRLEAILQNTSQKSGRDLQSVSDEFRNAVPMRRFGRPEETAEAIAFLVSSAANYISGISIPVDGGRTNTL